MHDLGAGCQSHLPLMQQTSILEWNKSQTNHERQMTRKRGIDRKLTLKTPPKWHAQHASRSPELKNARHRKAHRLVWEKRVKKVQKRPGRRTRACRSAPPEELTKNNRHCRTYRGAKCAHTHHPPLPLPRLSSQKENGLAHRATIMSRDYSCSFRNTTT